MTAPAGQPGNVDVDQQEDRPYLQGTEHGRFHETPRLAEAINKGRVVYELPYRGELLQVVHPATGPFPVRQRFAVIRETWFGDQASQWVRFPNEAAAVAWCRTTADYWLREHSGWRDDQHFGVWRGNGWQVEIDRARQRYTVAVGLAPGTVVEVFDSRAAGGEGEHPATVEARGWFKIMELLPVEPTDWPGSMGHAYSRALTAVSELAAERRREAAERAAVDAERTPALVEPEAVEEVAVQERRTVGWFRRLLAALFSIGRRP
ncbi:hypothetical protein ADK60_40265 [Streptomyces sp. XY431]|uniref:hypothetical protein n=1 Tax=Streptomyces sp. XY431 TaxID=1415562 RepID=UPI0006AE150E|nr:hypothetical protein [Streptomyces sp. XY431]KOV09613.1 hypothetical protein ADK60_40265 [Streptomyces sp. XY431]